MDPVEVTRTEIDQTDHSIPLIAIKVISVSPEIISYFSLKGRISFSDPLYLTLDRQKQ